MGRAKDKPPDKPPGKPDKPPGKPDEGPPAELIGSTYFSRRYFSRSYFPKGW